MEKVEGRDKSLFLRNYSMYQEKLPLHKMNEILSLMLNWKDPVLYMDVASISQAHFPIQAIYLMCTPPISPLVIF